MTKNTASDYYTILNNINELTASKIETGVNFHIKFEKLLTPGGRSWHPIFPN